MIEKLGVAGGFVFFLLVAAGVAISSNDHGTQILHEGKPGFDAAIDHVFYGINFAVMVILLSLAGLVAIVLLLGLAVASVLLSFDRAIKPINAMERK